MRRHLPCRPDFVALLAAVALAPAYGCSDAEDGQWVAMRTAAAVPGPAPAVGPMESEAVLCVDTEASIVRWRGREKIGSGHAGTVGFLRGHLTLRADSVVGGRAIVDMRTIAITDIPKHEVAARRQLREHLSHEEFFGVDRFPTARIVLTGVERATGDAYRVSGDLAIRDSVHNVTFDVAAPVVGEDEVRARARFRFDRRAWGVDFDGLTSALRNAIVDDMIELDVSLVARAAPSPGAACAGATQGTADSSRPRFD